jgi:hypothetical protein
MNELNIPPRFNGPPSSGNGGYSCGVVAAHIAGIARVRLHSPPPLDTPMQLHGAEQHALELRSEGTLIATGVTAELQLEIPQAPTLEQARKASEGYPGHREHMFGSCFVCGTKRAPGDGLRLFPGPVDDWSLVAAPWEPPTDLLDAHGDVLPEIVWSALDCPGCYGALGENMVPVLLGELVAELRAPVPGNEPLIVYAWPLGREGRKAYGGTAIANQAGDVLACSHSTWIILKKD